MCHSENGFINIDDFITQFLETEDTINFRIQLDKSKIDELNKGIEELK